MDATIVVAAITATGAVLVALIGAGWLARRRAPLPPATADPETLRQLEIEKATAELYREQRDVARSELLDEQEARSVTIASLTAERADHALTKRLLDDCARQKDGVTSMLRMVERQLAATQGRESDA